LKILSLTARILFIIAVPALLFSASIAIAVNSQWLYEYGFEKYNISQVTGLDHGQLEKAAEGLISYFNSDEEWIDLTVTRNGDSFELFNQREILHLKDVKELFRLDYRVLLVSGVYALGFLAYAIGFKKDRRYLSKGLIWGGGVTLGLMLLTGAGIALNFDRLFLLFHLVSFDNDFWMLNPATDYLIMLFPQGFWFDAAVFIALTAAVLAAATGGAGFWLARKRRSNDPLAD